MIETDDKRHMMGSLLKLLEQGLDKSTGVMPTTEPIDPLHLKKWDSELCNLVAMMKKEKGTQNGWIRKSTAIRRALEGGE